MKVLEACVDIDGSAGLVWAVICDIQRYHEWNPFITRAAGVLESGGYLLLTIQPPGLKPTRFHPRVLEVVPGRSIHWKGQIILPGLFDAQHTLLIDSLDDGRTRFTIREEARGLLIPFTEYVRNASQEGFELMCRALDRRVAELAKAAAGPS